MANGIAPAQTVKDLGGVGGALAKEAQQLYDSLSDVDKRIARRAFLAMVRLGEGTLDTRRRAAVPEIVGQGENPGHVMAVLRVFSQPDRRLVTLSAEADAIVTAEVTHEALLEDWGLVRDWLIAGRDDIRFHRRLAEAAEHWNEHGRAKGLLWRPPDLDLLRKYEERASSDMTSMQVAFFAASKQQHQRTRTLRRIAITGLAALAIIAAGVAIYADQQRLMANWERNRALATQSLFLTNVSERETTAGNATNGILLALEGLPSNLSSPNRPHVPEAQLALYFGVHELRERIVADGFGKSRAVVGRCQRPECRLIERA